jgi:hypothetical protein
VFAVRTLGTLSTLGTLGHMFGVRPGWPGGAVGPGGPHAPGRPHQPGRGGAGRGHILSLHDERELMFRATRPIAFQVDGEYVGEREHVTFRSVPDALRVIG